MRLVSIGGARLHIAGEAEFECNAALVNLLDQCRILQQPRRVSDAMRMTVVHRLPDRVGTITLTRMTGAGKAMLLAVLER